MKTIYPVSVAQAAPLLNTTVRTVQRHVADLDLGRQCGPVRLLSETEIERLRGVVRKNPGNPNFIPGNALGGRRKKSRKIRKK